MSYNRYWLRNDLSLTFVLGGFFLFDWKILTGNSKNLYFTYFFGCHWIISWLYNKDFSSFSLNFWGKSIIPKCVVDLWKFIENISKKLCKIRSLFFERIVNYTKCNYNLYWIENGVGDSFHYSMSNLSWSVITEPYDFFLPKYTF